MNFQSKARRRGCRARNSPISLGAVVREDLPLPVVHYPNHYGTFFAFSRDEESPPVLCSCSKGAVENAIRFQRLSRERYGDPRREAPLGSWYFPNTFADMSLAQPGDPMEWLQFEDRLCHRCNMVTPTLRYCHEMYGGEFKQHYGWYINQAYLRFGIEPLSLDYLPDVCPPELQREVDRVRKARSAFLAEQQRLLAIGEGPRRPDIGPGEVTYWSNVKVEEAKEMVRLRRAAARTERAFRNKIENIARQEFGFRGVGEGWVSETLLYHVVCRLLEGHLILRHHRPDWLEGLELDIFVPDLALAIEYQGQQHFHPVEAWGGKAGLLGLQARDARKRELCRANSVALVEVDYTEPLTEEHIRGRLYKAVPGVVLARREI